MIGRVRLNRRRKPPQSRISPARDAREQALEPSERKIKLGDAEYAETDVRAALAHKIEAEARKAALPQSPDKYEIKLPPDFKPPEGVKFEFDMNSPELKRFREIAHQRGMDQESFSDALGVYAANKVGELQRLSVARNAELAKLGSAAPARLDAIETWLKARVGTKANVIVAQLKNYPVASMVETFEGLMRQFSGQGAADFSQSGRQQQEDTGRISGYENMSFAQRRAAQDADAARRGTGR